MRILIMVALISCLFSSITYAFPSANIVYYETDLGNGSWQYDYIYYNTSTSNEYLYNVWFDFVHTSEITGLPLPKGWNGIIWEGVNTTDYLDTFSTNVIYDIPAGSSLDGFSFTVNYQAGDIPYTAYFDTGSGTSFISGITAMVPEPISSVLFIIGGATLAFRRFLKSKG